MKRQGGFTLTEITLSMAIFGLMMMIVFGSVLLVFHMYQQGSVTRDVQQNARAAMEVMLRDSRSASQASTGTNKICVLSGGGTWQMFFVSSNNLYVVPTFQADCL